MDEKITVGSKLNIESMIDQIKVFATPPYLYFKRWYYYLQGHRGVGDPLRIYYVRPEDIQYTIGSTSFTDPPGAFEIKAGDWDLNKRPAKDSGKLSMFKKHFEESIPWKETEEYQRKQNQIEERTVRTLDVETQSANVYDEYLEYMDVLYERIENEGYKKQHELSADNDFAKRRIHPALNEIQLMIGRNGELICSTGFHRLAIVKIQNIPEIPVRTQCRHLHWQRIRDELYSTASEEKVSAQANKYIGHPELSDITNTV